ncbi:MAG: hypothetical protein LBF56_00305 [Holosporales bacterium]|jgi:hypothetical protein|nr:hypothetical protein [Holosporales bacterium]
MLVKSLNIYRKLKARVDELSDRSKEDPTDAYYPSESLPYKELTEIELSSNDEKHYKPGSLQHTESVKNQPEDPNDNTTRPVLYRNRNQYYAPGSLIDQSYPILDEMKESPITLIIN